MCRARPTNRVLPTTRVCARMPTSRRTATIAFCYWECSRPTYKPGRTDSKARRLANTPSLSRFATFWFGVYLAAWALLIFLLLLDDVVKADEAAFNPFEILGVEVRRRPVTLFLLLDVSLRVHGGCHTPTCIQCCSRPLILSRRRLHRKEPRKIKSKKRTVKRAKHGTPATRCAP